MSRVNNRTLQAIAEGPARFSGREERSVARELRLAREVVKLSRIIADRHGEESREFRTALAELDALEDGG